MYGRTNCEIRLRKRYLLLDTLANERGDKLGTTENHKICLLYAL